MRLLTCVATLLLVGVLPGQRAVVEYLAGGYPQVNVPTDLWFTPRLTVEGTPRLGSTYTLKYVSPVFPWWYSCPAKCPPVRSIPSLLTLAPAASGHMPLFISADVGLFSSDLGAPLMERSYFSYSLVA